MTSPSENTPNIIRHVPAGQICCDPEWEAAYERFETPEDEIEKFIRRLKRFGFDDLPKDSRIAEIFCGRGGGLVALELLGFANVEGVDLSDTLLEQYRGPARLHLADCTDLPLESDHYDVVIVQGGLHHLPTLPDDLEAVLVSVKRILQPAGTFYLVEPWSTPFLTFAHLVTDHPLVRKFYARGDALAVMTELERETYEQWLGQPNSILDCLDRHFVTKSKEIGWGKLAYAGSPRP